MERFNLVVKFLDNCMKTCLYLGFFSAVYGAICVSYYLERNGIPIPHDLFSMSHTLTVVGLYSWLIIISLFSVVVLLPSINILHGDRDLPSFFEVRIGSANNTDEFKRVFRMWFTWYGIPCMIFWLVIYLASHKGAFDTALILLVVYTMLTAVYFYLFSEVTKKRKAFLVFKLILFCLLVFLQIGLSTFVFVKIYTTIRGDESNVLDFLIVLASSLVLSTQVVTVKRIDEEGHLEDNLTKPSWDLGNRYPFSTILIAVYFFMAMTNPFVFYKLTNSALKKSGVIRTVILTVDRKHSSEIPETLRDRSLSTDQIVSSSTVYIVFETKQYVYLKPSGSDKKQPAIRLEKKHLNEVVLKI